MAGEDFTEFLYALGPAFGGSGDPVTEPLPVFHKYRGVLTDPSFPKRLHDFRENVASETDIFRKTLATQGLVWLHRWLVAASQKDPGLRAAVDSAQSVAALVESAKNRDSLYLDFIEEFARAPNALKFAKADAPTILEDSRSRGHFLPRGSRPGASPAAMGRQMEVTGAC